MGERWRWESAGLPWASGTRSGLFLIYFTLCWTLQKEWRPFTQEILPNILFWWCRINLLSSIPQFFKAINILFSHNLHLKSRSNGPTQYFYTCQKTWQDGNCLIELYSTSVWRHLYLLCFPAHLSGALSGSRVQGWVRVTSKLITGKIAQ